MRSNLINITKRLTMRIWSSLTSRCSSLRRERSICNIMRRSSLEMQIDYK
jgi:hypothetical protein